MTKGGPFVAVGDREPLEHLGVEPAMPAASSAHADEIGAVACRLDTDATHGLSAAGAAARLVRHGPNRLRLPRRLPTGRLVIRQLADPLVALLVAAAVVSGAVGETVEAGAIGAVLLLNAALGFWHELAAERAIRALGHALTHVAVVVRDGVEQEVPVEQVVPGDVLLLREGDRVAADARIVAAAGLETDESALTGESMPVAKHARAVDFATPLAERASMAYAGTAATRGHARAIVVATGGATELGEVEALAAAAKPPPTPLARRLAMLARQMVAAGTLLTLALAGVMLARGEPFETAFLVGVAVAIAAVPEGLAATVTVALGLASRAMAARGALVRRLDAIETIGEVTAICTDKTGTLTENELRVAALRPADGVDERALLEAALLASSAHTSATGRVLGDPVDAALAIAALERGLRFDDVHRGRSLLLEIPFESERRHMSAVYAEAGGRRVYTKGAPEVVGVAGTALAGAVAAWASEGFRVLAVATREMRSDETLDGTPDTTGRLVGVVALHDPLRTSAPHAVAAARRAGITVRMVTGDHPTTARAIGRALGFAPADVLARAAPAEKLALVEDLQRAGEVVAVTGDGINDAPALRRADVGIAMGRSGTEAARESAAIVLTDDDFATIVAAIREGRRIGDNIRKFVAFLLSANVGEVIVFAVAIGFGLGAPLAVVQVLVVNLVTDGLPAVALTGDPASSETMSRAPRRDRRLFGRTTWLVLGGVGVVVGAATLAAFVLGRALGDAALAQTMAFATLALGELALVFALRSPHIAAWRLPANRWLLATVATSVALVFLLIYAPFAQQAFATTPLAAGELLAAVGLALVPFVVVEAAKLARRLRGPALPQRDVQGDDANALARAQTGEAVHVVVVPNGETAAVPDQNHLVETV